jgi:hypothetical protein
MNGNCPPEARAFYDRLRWLGTRPIDTHASSPLVPYDTASLRLDSPTTSKRCLDGRASTNSSLTRHDSPSTPSKTVPKAPAKRNTLNDSSPPLPKILLSTSIHKSLTRSLLSDFLEAASSSSTRSGPSYTICKTGSSPITKRICVRDSPPALTKALSSSPESRTPTRRPSHLFASMSSSPSRPSSICTPTQTASRTTTDRIASNHSFSATLSPLNPSRNLGAQSQSSRVDPLNSTTDSTYSPSNHTLAASFPASLDYDKPEVDVFNATDAFLRVLQQALGERLGPLGIVG